MNGGLIMSDTKEYSFLKVPKVSINAIDSERALLSFILQTKPLFQEEFNEFIKNIFESLNWDNFYRLDYRIIFKTMSELFKEGYPVNTITLSERLENNDYSILVGIVSKLNYSSDFSTIEQVKEHINYILEAFKKRSLVEFCIESINFVYDSDEEGKSALEIYDIFLRKLSVVGTEAYKFGSK